MKCEHTGCKLTATFECRCEAGGGPLNPNREPEFLCDEHAVGRSIISSIPAMDASKVNGCEDVGVFDDQPIHTLEPTIPSAGPDAKSLELFKPTIDTLGGAPAVEHNMPCSICWKRAAVMDMSRWIFEPCWGCQEQGWTTIRKKKSWWQRLRNRFSRSKPT